MFNKISQLATRSLKPKGMYSAAAQVSPASRAHFPIQEKPLPEFSENILKNPCWTADQMEAISKTHVAPRDISDQAARYMFDTLSGYRFGELTEAKVLNRAIFLETGFTAAIIRHLRSLRRMERDQGWINTLLEEAENERMHLLTFITLKKPGFLFRFCVVVSQGIFMNGFFFAYLINPKICHRFVGYLEEEAVKTYSDIIEAIDDGRLERWNYEPAPAIAIDYWRMQPDAKMRDLIMAVRADEASHRDVNHTFSEIGCDNKNPFQ